jgi:hypothetical protein
MVNNENLYNVYAIRIHKCVLCIIKEEDEVSYSTDGTILDIKPLYIINIPPYLELSHSQYYLSRIKLCLYQYKKTNDIYWHTLWLESMDQIAWPTKRYYIYSLFTNDIAIVINSFCDWLYCN